MRKLLLLFAFLSFASGILAQVSKTINLTTAGTLSTKLTSTELSTITNLTLTGTMDARDFKTMRDDMPVLAVLDMGGVTIAEYNGTGGTNQVLDNENYPANVFPDYAFLNQITYKHNTSLISIVLPSSITSFGLYALGGCSGLTTITIPSSVTSIGDAAFADCTGLTSISIPSSVTSIGMGAFRYCIGLTSITIPSSVTSIEVGVFQDCLGLTSITIPSSVTSIGYCAFTGCLGLTSITIPSSVTSIGDYAFSECLGLTSITIPSSVTSIGMYAFSGCSKLTTVTIPSSVTSIGVMAFTQSSGLITVDPNNPNYSSIDGVLYNKAQTTLVHCPISKEGSFTIPTSVTSIGDYAFRYCLGLTSITIPSSVITIGVEAFWGCIGLTTVTIPSSVITIKDEAFALCYGLTSITIPSSVTTIGQTVFWGCSGLTTVTIPSSVTSIGSDAFNDCNRLTSIIMTRLTPVDLRSSPQVFSGVNKINCTLYVPVGSKSAYQAADQWMDFMNIVENDFTGIDPMISDQQLNVYPNPTTGKVKLVFDQVPPSGTIMTVSDFTGKTILTRSIQNKEVGIDLSGNSPGVYLIRTSRIDFEVQKVILK